MRSLPSYYRSAFFIREFENFLIELFRRGELNGTVHTCVGQELTPVVLASFLKKGDKIFSNHRGHGHYLAFGGSPKALLAEILGLTTGVSGGIGGSQHLMNEGFISNGIQGGMAPIAAGYAFANAKKGTDNVAVVFIGDGTLGEGVLYEAMNLASVFNCPVVFVLENNGYAQSTSGRQTFRGSVAGRVEGFGIRYNAASIWDVDGLSETFATAVSYARTGMPVFVEVDCYRLNSHSKGDDNRSETEIESYREKDPLNVFVKVNAVAAGQLIEDSRNEIMQLYDDCKKDTFLTEMKRHSYIHRTDYQLDLYQPSQQAQQLRINKLIYHALRDTLEAKEHSLLMGEDIQDTTDYTDRSYGGAFKVTGDLSTLFPDKVFNTPISEAGMIGFGLGAALNGYTCIVEIMFGDFLTLGFDQLLQQASKIPEMFGKPISLPFIIRTPMGGRRGYGPTHSQNIEKHFLFIPNVNVIALNSVLDPSIVYKAIGDHCTTATIVIEDKIAYTRFLNSYKINGYTTKVTDEAFPTVIFEPRDVKANCTVLLYGGMLDETLETLEKLISEDIVPRIICPSRISPFNISPLIDSLKTAAELISVEEGSKYGAFSSEVISYLKEHNIPFTVKNRISNESIIPCSKAAERNVVPNAELIFQTLIDG